MKTADLIIQSKAIFDSVHDEPYPGGIAIEGEKILYVGSDKELQSYIGPTTIIRDFGDKLIMPGFCDGHIHYDGLAKNLFAEVVRGLEDLKSEEECAAAVKAFADLHPHLSRIHGFGWMLTSWGTNPQHPTRNTLDKVLPDKPVYLQSSDGHVMWLNSKAIEESRLEEILLQHPDIPDKLAHRDENGLLTGYFAEKACAFTHSFDAVYTPEQTSLYHKKLLKMLNSYGITGFTDVSMMSYKSLPVSFSVLKSMENSGELTLRCYIWAGIGPDSSGSIEDAVKIREQEVNFCSDKLRIAGIKSVIDGIPFSFTSALLEPYSDNPSVKGETIHPSDVYIKWVEKVNKLGYAVKFHCTGDAAIRLALDSFENSNKVNDNSNLRNAVEHMDIVSYEDIPRYAKLGVIASMQPSHLIMLKGIGALRYGERSKREWNFRKLIEAGVKLSIGTDGPVVDINPLYTVYKAVTRKDLNGTQYSPYTTDQALTLPEVLKGYTTGSAYASNMESKVGTLEAGKYADIAVINRNLFAINADDIKDCHVACTIFNGNIIYEA